MVDTAETVTVMYFSCFLTVFRMGKYDDGLGLIKAFYSLELINGKVVDTETIFSIFKQVFTLLLSEH